MVMAFRARFTGQKNQILAVAILIDAVFKNFGSAGMDVGIIVVAVIGRAAARTDGGIAVAIDIGGQKPFINLTVTVVVLAVANLRVARVDSGVAVITVIIR